MDYILYPRLSHTFHKRLLFTFYQRDAMLWHGTGHHRVSVRPSVWPSQVGVRVFY